MPVELRAAISFARVVDIGIAIVNTQSCVMLTVSKNLPEGGDTSDVGKLCNFRMPSEADIETVYREALFFYIFFVKSIMGRETFPVLNREVFRGVER